MKISTSKTEVLHFSRNPVQCSLQVGGASLKQVKMFKYLGDALTSDGRKDEELVVRSGKPSALMRALHYSVVLVREPSRKAKFSLFKSIFVHILTYGHKSWVMTERVRSQMQASEIRYLRKLKVVRYLTNFITLRLENLSALSRYFTGSKNLSLDGLAT